MNPENCASFCTCLSNEVIRKMEEAKEAPVKKVRTGNRMVFPVM